MPFPSLSALTRRATQVLRRFPLTLVLAVVATSTAMAAADSSGDDLLWRIALVALLGLPLSIGVALLATYRGWSVVRQSVWQAAGLVVLGLFFITWPGPEQQQQMLRFLQLAAIFHLGVSVLPFIRGRETTAFWQYNRKLFESFLRATLFSAVLFAGMAVALGALDQLFGIHVPERTYLRLWLLMAFLVHPWIFLAGVPDQAEELSYATYPRALKLFTQYVLTPLVAVYLVIVVAYLGKIIVTGDWPSGWIGYLVASVSVAGILGFLLVHPLRALPEEAWIRTYTRGLFLGLIPASIMLLLALWQRVQPYGLTPLRILGLVLGIWLLAIAVLYTVARGTSIRTIPLSLAAVLAICFGGPLGVRTLAVDSQADRLKALLNQPHATRERARQASAALGFLLQYNATGAIRGVFGDSALQGVQLASITWPARDSVANRLLKSRGIRYSAASARSQLAPQQVVRPASEGVPVSGYDWMIRVGTSHDTATIHLGGHVVRIRIDSTRARLRVQPDSMPQMSFAIDSIYDNFQLADSGAKVSALRVERSVPTWRFLLALDHIYASRDDTDSLHISGWEGQLFVERE